MLSCLYLLFFYPLLLTLQAAYFPQASNFQNLVFFPLPIVFSILSIMLQAIFQKLMVVVVVVFFYLLILKGPMFLPGLVFFFSSRNRLNAFLFWTAHVHLDAVRDLLREVRLEGRMPVPCPASEGAARGGQGHGPHWQESSFLVSLIFWQGRTTTCQT